MFIVITITYGFFKSPCINIINDLIRFFSNKESVSFCSRLSVGLLLEVMRWTSLSADWSIWSEWKYLHNCIEITLIVHWWSISWSEICSMVRVIAHQFQAQVYRPLAAKWLFNETLLLSLFFACSLSIRPSNAKPAKWRAKGVEQSTQWPKRVSRRWSTNLPIYHTRYVFSRIYCLAFSADFWERSFCERKKNFRRYKSDKSGG